MLPRAHATPRERIDAPASGWRIAAALLGEHPRGGHHCWNLDGDRMPHGLEESLATRLTVKNVLLTAFRPALAGGAICLRPLRSRQASGWRGRDWPRLLVASGIGCLLVMIFTLTSASGAVSPEHASFFDVAVLISTATLRGTVRTAQQASGANRRQRIVIGGRATDSTDAWGAAVRSLSCA
jgi:hypothetical protein